MSAVNIYNIFVHAIFEDVEKYIDEHNGEAHDYSDVVNQFTFNVANEVVCGKRFKLSDPTYQQIRKYLSNIFITFFQHCYLHLSGTLFKYYLRFTSNAEQTLRNDFDKLKQHANKLIAERKQQLSNESYICKFFVDLWIKECKNPDNKHLPSDNLAGNIVEIWVGNETVSGVMYNGIKLMALYPKVQNSVYNEI
ncbi:cytochrome P450 2J2-like protein, partial [Leptotrombidium deliense]